MADSDGISIRVVGYLVNAWHLIATNSIDNKVCRRSLRSCLILLRRVRPVDSTFHPVGLSIEILNNLFRKSDGSTTWSIKLMDMVGFLHLHIILLEAIHNLCQISVYGREDGYTNREVGSPEESLTLFGTHTTNIVAMLFHPSCRTRNHLHIMCKSAKIVAISSLWSCKLYGNISRSKFWRIEILLVVYIYNAYYLVSTVFGNLLNHLAHLAVAYQCNFHVFCVLCSILFADIST